jgi:hypothetical protein
VLSSEKEDVLKTNGAREARYEETLLILRDSRKRQVHGGETIHLNSKNLRFSERNRINVKGKLETNMMEEEYHNLPRLQRLPATDEAINALKNGWPLVVYVGLDGGSLAIDALAFHDAARLPLVRRSNALLKAVPTELTNDFDTLKSAIEKSWSEETGILSGWCVDGSGKASWNPENPARGQGAGTALIIHDFFGGRLKRCEVYDAPWGDYGRSHFYNELPDGKEVDLTVCQFPKGTTFGRFEYANRDLLLSFSPIKEQYKLLGKKVAMILKDGADPK